MINLLERLTASVGHRQAELAAVEASEGRALAFVAVNKATGAVACSDARARAYGLRALLGKRGWARIIVRRLSDG